MPAGVFTTIVVRPLYTDSTQAAHIVLGATQSVTKVFEDLCSGTHCTVNG